jgi:hypothetical protein
MQRWNIVDQSSIVRVTPFVVVSFNVGSGFCGKPASEERAELNA